jgi:arginine deiminase
MTPSTCEYFLFDDLLYDWHAQREHDWITSLMQDNLGIKLHFFDKLLAEALQSATDAERQSLIAQVCTLESDMPPVEQRIGQLEVLVRWYQGQGWPQYPHDPEGDPNAAAPGTLPGTLASLLSRARETAPVASQDAPLVNHLRSHLTSRCDKGDFHALALDLIEGIESGISGANNGNGHGEGEHGSEDPQSDALRRFIEGQLFYLTPVPNLMFMRDVAAVVGDGLLLSRMAAPGRVREPLLLDFVQRNHPMFRDTRRWTWADARISDPAWPVAASPNLHMEGGNLLQLREDIVVLALNQRTTLESAQRIADTWRAAMSESGQKMVLYVLRLPAGFNHLDSVFGMISEDECVIYPPVFESYGPASVDVVRVELGDKPVEPVRSADFFKSLRRDGLDLNPIQIGGEDPVDQQREQWFSAACLLAVAPGKVLIYRSCERTIEELANRGYRVLDINEVQTERLKLSLDEPGKWVIKTKGSELSRGHGGLHSMVLPLSRGNFEL